MCVWYRERGREEREIKEDLSKELQVLRILKTIEVEYEILPKSRIPSFETKVFFLKTFN